MPGTFNVDHSNMEVGIYSPGYDLIGDTQVVTVDVRCVSPYKGIPMSHKEMHTVEHVLAVEIGNACERYTVEHPEEPITKLYWGPMGCQTGFYLLVSAFNGIANRDVKICSILHDACSRVLEEPYYRTPANDPKKCGNVGSLFEYAHGAQWVLRTIDNACKRVIRNGKFDEYQLL